MVTIILRDGQKVTPWMDYQIGRLSHDMYNAFGVRVKVRSGLRTYEDQKRIFIQRYVTAGNVNGRRVYDTRWWNGQLWYRISSAGTVAQPGTSNHEIQGTKAAVDLYDTGSDPGITSRYSKRGRWIRANASKYDLIASGDGFGEGWHFDIRNINKTPPGTSGGGTTPAPKPTPKEEEEEDMPKNSGVHYKTGPNTWIYLVFNTGSGFAHEFSNGANGGTMPGTYTANLKTAMDISGWSSVTESHARVIKNALAAVRPKDAPKEVEVTIVTQAEIDALEG